MIGIDVSKYQGDINWQEVKNAGIEFAMIRLGLGYEDVTKMDEKYLQNIKGALENDIKVGIYFYSYATTMEEINLQTDFVLKNIKDYDITFPIVYDWENFKGWNEYGISLFDLRYQQEMFLKPFKEKGYQVLQYGSKNYLRNFWEPIKEDIWLAFYIREGQTQDFEKPIKMWQICNNGRVPGIIGDVDIDIYYK
jgi:GH25 family lysozyme M1 (1,4-beta-N-acetylmuramidase)